MPAQAGAATVPRPVPVAPADHTGAEPPPPPDGALVRARGLGFRFGRRAVLEDVRLEVGPGVTGLLGANGAGKTTLLTVLLGLRRPSAGSVEVFGRDPRRSGPEIRARIGFAPEHHRLPVDMAAADFVRHLAEVHGLPRRAAMERASDALWWVGLGEERFRALGTLSVGQRQRAKLAMAIAHDPRLVVLDEPTDGLDPSQREDLLALVRRVGDEFGIAVLLSSHLLEEVERTCDRVLMLSDGRIALAGAVADLRGAGVGIRVDVDGDAATLGRRLAARGHRVEVRGARLDLEPAPGADERGLARDVRDGVADLAIGLRRVQRRVATLEDVYLGLGP